MMTMGACKVKKKMSARRTAKECYERYMKLTATSVDPQPPQSNSQEAEPGAQKKQQQDEAKAGKLIDERRRRLTAYKMAVALEAKKERLNERKAGTKSARPTAEECYAKYMKLTEVSNMSVDPPPQPQQSNADEAEPDAQQQDEAKAGQLLYEERCHQLNVYKMAVVHEAKKERIDERKAETKSARPTAEECYAAYMKLTEAGNMSVDPPPQPQQPKHQEVEPDAKKQEGRAHHPASSK